MNTQNFCFVLKQNSHLLREGCFGLEKENVRVNQDGTLALTPHPAVFGDKGCQVWERLWDLWKHCTMW